MAKSNPAHGATAACGLDHSPSHLLHRAVQLALDIYAADADPGAATPRQYAVLCAVAADEGLSQSGLVRATGIDRSTLADMVSRMIGKGLVARARSEADARANAVRLTQEGRAMLERTTPRIAVADQRLLELLGAKKREPFVTALRRLAKAGELALLQESGETSSGLRPVEDLPAKVKKTKAGKAKGDKLKSKKKKAKRIEADLTLDSARAELAELEGDSVTP